MHIVIDCRFLTCSGIGRYIREIVSRLVQDDSLFFSLLVDDNDLDQVFISKCQKPNVSFINCRAKMYSIREQLELPWKVPSCDVFWAPHYNAPVLPVRAKRKIVTIYDMAHLALADMLGFGVAKRLYAKLLMYTSTHFYDDIFTISNFTKSEIIRFENISASKIHVYYLGVDIANYRPVTDQTLLRRVQEIYGLPERFFLFVGNVKPHKNLARLIEAYADLREKTPTAADLVIAGQRVSFLTGDEGIGGLIDRLQIEAYIHFTGYVEEQHLNALYTMAEAFVFPSLYEGFGLPPLEAMACGCPVIASDAASITEVCGSAATYFNPLDLGAITAAMRGIKVKPYSCEELQRRYSWDNCAEAIKKAMEKA